MGGFVIGYSDREVGDVRATVPDVHSHVAFGRGHSSQSNRIGEVINAKVTFRRSVVYYPFSSKIVMVSDFAGSHKTRKYGANSEITNTISIVPDFFDTVEPYQQTIGKALMAALRLGSNTYQ